MTAIAMHCICHTATFALSIFILSHSFRESLTTQAFLQTPPLHVNSHSIITPRPRANTNVKSIRYDDNEYSRTKSKALGSFNPLDMPSTAWDMSEREFELIKRPSPKQFVDAVTLTTLSSVALRSRAALADTEDVVSSVTESVVKRSSSENFNPQNFNPVCPTSDGIYRVLKSASINLIGEDNLAEYGPLLAGGLLRIRLELCVVESFFDETVEPFIEKNGLGWVLPFHETLETFVAGSIFALVSTFILVGSTKIVTVLWTFADVFVGGPCRLLGGFGYDRARGVPVTLDVGKMRLVGPKKTDVPEKGILEPKSDNVVDVAAVLVFGTVKLLGDTSKLFRDFFENADLFLGRNLFLYTTAYIGFKYVHYKYFPDFPDFEAF
mmetsp:Transcript_60028/g.71441  ORF Transcript_60028/g.71441 Transcript_60028/m.71441 type:complete len:381 (+) Transcript_60028:70-1212(+)